MSEGGAAGDQPGGSPPRGDRPPIGGEGDPMTFLSEDPTYLVGALGILAVSFLMALRVTQQGKYLYWALGALGLAAAVLAIEHFWVTDNERIERVVYDLRRAVLASDVDGVLEHLTPDVEYVQS